MDLTLIIIGLFILGTIFGSLGSVLVTRLGAGVNRHVLHGIFFGFSHCPQCQKQLKPRNLIPIVSFFLQKGLCENCKHPISKFYPILEFSSGIVFVLTYFLVGNLGGGTEMIIFWLLINWLFLLLIVYDFQKMELHVPLRIVTLCISLLGQFIFPLGNYGQAFFMSLVLGAICLGIFYAAKWYVKKRYKKETEGFGEGDIMMGFLLGTLLPFLFSFHQISFTISRIFEILILFFILSSLLGLLRYGKNILKGNFSSRMLPFIPFMIFSFWILLFAGKFFINLLFPRG